MAAGIENWTGERLETFIQNENTNEHLHRYAQALDLVRGKNVLDIACGEGYGSHLLAGLAAHVTGVDIDAQTIACAAKKYLKGNLDFLAGSASDIPCAGSSFDVVVSFETLEHHDKHDEMMMEIKRVLKPGGLCIISSPDKLYYSDKTGYKNPYHVKELYSDEFKDLLNRYFNHTFYLKQKSFVGSLMIPETDAANNTHITLYNGGYDHIEPGELEAVYIIGVASDKVLPAFKTTFFDGQAVLKEQFATFQDLVTRTVRADVEREIKSSRTYKLGYAIVTRLRAVKTFFHAS